MEDSVRFKKGSGKRYVDRQPFSTHQLLELPYDVAANIRVGTANETRGFNESELVADGDEDRRYSGGQQE